MKVVTARRMQELDRRAIDDAGVTVRALMESAGRAVADTALCDLRAHDRNSVCVICGSGNNGGDGCVAALRLRMAGARPSLCLVREAAAFKGDAAIVYRRARDAGVPVVERAQVLDRLANGPSFDLVIDAMLGTGASGSPRGEYAAMIAAVNASGSTVIAVDIPSGVDSDTGAVPGVAIRAAQTVTFGYPKLGMFLPPGADHVGRLRVSDIDFHWDTLEADTPYEAMLGHGGDENGGAAATEWRRLACDLLRRPADSHKGDYGHVAVIAGSRGMCGAPALVARSAQRIGAGLVTVLAPATAQQIVAAKLDEQMTLALPESDGALAASAFEQVASFARGASALCVGPGLTTAAGAVSVVHRTLAEVDRPVVLDADGLNALSLDPDVTRKRVEGGWSPLVLTPHPGEAARLLGSTVEDVQKDRVGAARAIAGRFNAIVALKGRHTLITGHADRVLINTTGNAGMASGGMGDALTGVIGGILAQVASRRSAVARHMGQREAPDWLHAAALGVFVHGLAGDMAAARRGSVGLLAGDLIDCVPAALAAMEEVQ